MATMHMSMSLEGCLRNFKGKKIRIFSDDDGNELTDREARIYISECLNKGWRVIPMGDCPDFDYQNGCNCWKKEHENESK